MDAFQIVSEMKAAGLSLVQIMGDGRVTIVMQERPPAPLSLSAFGVPEELRIQDDGPTQCPCGHNATTEHNDAGECYHCTEPGACVPPLKP